MAPNATADVTALAASSFFPGCSGRLALQMDPDRLQAVNLSSAWIDLSRPKPDCLKPPNGLLMSPASKVFPNPVTVPPDVVHETGGTCRSAGRAGCSPLHYESTSRKMLP
jgi:hypothetical protein